MHILVYKLKNTFLGKLFGFLFFFAICVPLVTHYYLGTESARDEFVPVAFHSRTKLDSVDSASLKFEELRREVDELDKIKISLNNELRELEGRRTQLQLEIQTYTERAETARSKAEKFRAEVGRARRELEIIKQAKIEANDCPQLPHLRHPKRLYVNSAKQQNNSKWSLLNSHSNNCELSSCFDFSRCSLSSGFPVHVYDPAVYRIGKSPHGFDLTKILTVFRKLPYFMSDGKNACLFVVLVGGLEPRDAKQTESKLHELPFWEMKGKNHLILQFSNNSSAISSLDINFGLAMFGLSSFHGRRTYRNKFDISVVPVTSIVSGEVWQKAPYQLPAVRKYFLSFEGQLSNSSSVQGITINDLNDLTAEASDFHLKISCQGQHSLAQDNVWSLCGNVTYRATLLRCSTFTLILGPTDRNASWDTVLVRLVEALQYGAVPVILADRIVLPFNDVIDWKAAAVILPEARVTEINFVLRTMTNEDLLNMRQQGRFLWETYFSTTEAIMHTLLSNVRTRISLPAATLPSVRSESVFDAENPPLKGDPDPDSTVQLRHPSPVYFRNFTSTTLEAYQIWNSPPGAFWMFPTTPFDPVLPSSAPFMHSAKGFDLIGNGEGGAGVEFSKALGGNVAKEQFTIVMLTYERELVLLEALQRLVGLQYLNKVVVVWNSPKAPIPSLQWPDIGVPIEVIKSGKNSLNNRFMPYDIIDTDCILSIDDDAHLRHDEMLLGFRVWRESRDRVVGFPGRYHAWDTRHGGWLYNANHTCELSMVLTGAAFFHKYYAYLYTYLMPQAIRDKVDELMNCEDIAMNFLVSHITRKPPLKVTSRWTFSCPGCPVALHQDESHFLERHECINFFEKVYGYMPLLRTQFRVDSVLFKTRIPSSKTKCFKYV